MSNIMQCHALVFQTLEDLKAACIEAADAESQVRDFEVGVFCGHYRSPVAADYLERSSRLYRNTERKSTAVTDKEGDAGAMRTKRTLSKLMFSFTPDVTKSVLEG